MALKILLADPNEEWLESTAKYLTEQMYEVKAVDNGKDAQLALYNDNFFAVILNYSLQNHSGVQVLKFVKSNYTNQRIIMMMESRDMLGEEAETTEEKLIKMGATEIICKPFEESYLKDVLEGHQSLGDLVSSLPKREGVSAEEEVQLGDESFTQVKIDEFYSAQSVLFDVYIRLGSGRYVKILHAGDTFSKERIDKYKKEKNVEHLYFHNTDRRKFVQYNNFLAKKLIDNTKVSAAPKVKLLKSVADKFLEETFAVGLKPQVIQQGKEICENIFSLVEKQQDLYKVLRDFQDFDPNAYTHAYLVSIYTTAIIKQYEWQSKSTTETAALACLFHDIGKMKLPKEMLDMRPKDMTDEQLELYKQHPEFGAKLLEGNHMVNNSVKQVILQHHEAFDGSGFPEGKKGSKILTIANIVALADDFVHVILEKQVKPVDALKVILSNPDQVKKYNSTIVENFIKVFVDPEKIKKDHALPSNSRMVPSKKVS